MTDWVAYVFVNLKHLLKTGKSLSVETSLVVYIWERSKPEVLSLIFEIEIEIGSVRALGKKVGLAEIKVLEPEQDRFGRKRSCLLGCYALRWKVTGVCVRTSIDHCALVSIWKSPFSLAPVRALLDSGLCLIPSPGVVFSADPSLMSPKPEP